MAEKMTLEQVRDRLRRYAKDSDLYAIRTGHTLELTIADQLADAIDAQLANPAQAVDVRAIREVIAYLQVGHRFDVDMADKLTRAIGNAQADD